MPTRCDLYEVTLTRALYLIGLAAGIVRILLASANDVAIRTIARGVTCEVVVVDDLV